MKKEPIYKSIKNTKHGAFDIRLVGLILALLGAVGISTLLVAFLTIWGGRKLDAQWGTDHLMIIILGVVGLLLIVAVVTIVSVRISGRMQKILKENKRKEEDKID